MFLQSVCLLGQSEDSPVNRATEGKGYLRRCPNHSVSDKVFGVSNYHKVRYTRIITSFQR